MKSKAHTIEKHKTRDMPGSSSKNSSRGAVGGDDEGRASPPYLYWGAAGAAAAIGALGIGLYLAKTKRSRRDKNKNKSNSPAIGGSVEMLRPSLLSSSPTMPETAQRSASYNADEAFTVSRSDPLLDPNKKKSENINAHRRTPPHSCRHAIVHKRSPIPADVVEHSSFSNYHECPVTHMQLVLSVDFERHVLSGHVVCTVQIKKSGVERVVLDTRDLAVQGCSVSCSANGGKFVPADYSYGPRHEAFGSALQISLPAEVTRTEGASVRVRIDYETTPTCTAIQWLSAEQTAGKKHPYMFTQCQAIHCRSMMPCQDAPAVKVSYDASIKVKAPLVALMSACAENSGNVESAGQSMARYSFKQDVPLPAYLIALAAGDLECRDIGPRTRVWSEPCMVELGAFEFSDTERFLCAAEEICGPYVWGRYDLLLLPPSFPYGGMENPCLTFVTPTLLAGDKSLVSVVAHEIAHSWMGNLVTNATWEDFWMNEGFTVFVERRIVSRVYGEQRAGLKGAIGWRHLVGAVERFGQDHDFTKLHIPMEGVDPDDSFSSVPYEKGFAFLCYLESIVGREEFEEFLKAHVARYCYGTVSAEDWKAFFLEYFFARCADDAQRALLLSIDWDTWLHCPGLPPVKPQLDTTLLEKATTAADEWFRFRSLDIGEEEEVPASMGELTSDELVVFLERLLELSAQSSKTASVEWLDALASSFGFRSTQNAEVRFRWLTLCIREGDSRAHEGAVDMLISQGRMKFVRPLYRDLHASGPQGSQRAVETFVAHKHMYHAICRKMVARDLGVAL